MDYFSIFDIYISSHLLVLTLSLQNIVGGAGGVLPEFFRYIFRNISNIRKNVN